MTWHDADGVVVRVGVIGCGNVSTKYLKNLIGRPSIRIVACADTDRTRAETLASQYPGMRACNVEELLFASDIDLVLNLTAPAAHFDVSMAVLRAGKHVYSEKPLATTLDDARALVREAEVARLRIGVAPDTFLGAGTQRNIRLLEDGAIGTPISVSAAVLNAGPERFHPHPDFLYQNGAGPLFDIGPYYVTVLTAMLGPVARAAAFAVSGRKEREILTGPRTGERFEVETPTHVTAILQFRHGSTATLTTSFDVVQTGMPNLEIYGVQGTISAPQANSWGGPIFISTGENASFVEVPLSADAEHGYMGMGLVDLAASIVECRPHQASGTRGFHVLEVLTAISESARRGGVLIDVTSTTEEVSTGAV
ncbi:putative dehydrogenase [Mycetocola sp. CAN_C7]|uniref:Gfo/Idh/MocA family protein n=1 Tax=Mycetocola sp. CAN_C7 TaxID=2787724 RepID=UPI0018C96688